MPINPKTESDDFRPEDSPAAWFVELLLSSDRGDYRRATEAQSRLRDLGWLVSRQKPRHTAPRREGGH
jgi:hypothetical protein